MSLKSGTREKGLSQGIIVAVYKGATPVWPFPPFLLSSLPLLLPAPHVWLAGWLLPCSRSVLSALHFLVHVTFTGRRTSLLLSQSSSFVCLLSPFCPPFPTSDSPEVKPRRLFFLHPPQSGGREFPFFPGELFWVRNHLPTSCLAPHGGGTGSWMEHNLICS